VLHLYHIWQRCYLIVRVSIAVVTAVIVVRIVVAGVNQVVAKYQTKSDQQVEGQLGVVFELHALNGRHEFNDLIVKAQQVHLQIVLVHNDQLVVACVAA